MTMAVRDKSLALPSRESCFCGSGDEDMQKRVSAFPSGTYSLDCRPHADPSRISPAKDVSADQDRLDA